MQMATRRGLPASALLVLLAACGGSGGAGADRPPRVVVTEPSTDVLVPMGRGNTIRITYRNEDPDDVAWTDLLADRDGDLSTTHDQVPIAPRRPEAAYATLRHPRLVLRGSATAT